MQSRIYLDWNASAPLRPEARTAMLEALACCGNPSSVHLEGRLARGLVERARRQLAAVFLTDPVNVTFTSGATEAAALALAGRNLQASDVEHECVRAWTSSGLETRENGRIVITDPRRSTVQLANSETGVIQDLPVGLAVCDATQGLGKIDIGHLSRTVAYVFVSAHKIGGPKGVGALVCFRGSRPEPRIRGGGQEFGKRSGTENIAGIAGFGAAAEAAAQEVADGVWEQVGCVRDAMETAISDTVEDVVLFGADADRLPNTSCFAAKGWKGETQVIDMDLRGFSISAGSACSSGRVKASNVLRAMGVSRNLAACAIRVSTGPATELTDVLRFAETWGRCRNRVRNRNRAASLSRKDADAVLRGE